jgi:hypothetical protein
LLLDRVSRPDPQAVETLLSTFWSSAGWREDPSTEPSELERAIAAGVMFDAAAEATHDEIVDAVRGLVRRTPVDAVAGAFVSSLVTRRLDLRSALGSYAVARHLPEHVFEIGPSHISGACAICGLDEVERDIDRNILNFERFKWGGVRRDDLTYVWLDLELFQAADDVDTTAEGRRVLAQLLDELNGAAPETTTATAARTMLRALKGNTEERAVLLDILGVCSVLETPEHRGYLETFIPAADRVLPERRFVDSAYPVCWWRAADGVNREATQAFRLI